MSEVSELSGRRIHVVEDEVMVSCMLDDMLGQLGGEVVGLAARVDQVLALIATKDVDAAILDVDLNRERSYPVADALKARSVPFVFSAGDRPKGLQNAYLLFPML